MIEATWLNLLSFVGVGAVIGLTAGYLEYRSWKAALKYTIILAVAALFLYAVLASPKWRGQY